MSTFLPLDSNQNPIPALKLKSGGAHSISASATTARNASAFDADTKVISVYADVAVFLAMGADDVTASSSDHFFPAGIYYDFAIGDDVNGQATHIAVLHDGADGTVYISEKH